MKRYMLGKHPKCKLVIKLIIVSNNYLMINHKLRQRDTFLWKMKEKKTAKIA